MSANLNRFQLIGNLGAKPELRFAGTGNAVCNFNVATRDVRVSKDNGARTETTEWHRVVAFGPLAEQCAKYLDKGRLVYVDGRIQYRTYEKDGVTRQVTEVKANDVQFLSSPSADRAASSSSGASDATPFTAEEDELPF